MKDDYLWNKQGRDREVEALEELLAPQAYDARARKSDAASAPPGSRRRPVLRWAVGLTAAAALVIGARVLWRPEAVTLTPTSDAPARLAPTLLATGELDLERYGSVTVREGARGEILSRTDDDIRLRLERGTIEARITLAARPRLFQVETPATTCVDLGCHYTLTVEEDGSTFVRVDLGQVAFVDQGRETWVPSGASCRARPGLGSGTPRWDDADGALLARIDALDRAVGGERVDAAGLVIAACGRERDALTLWHLAHDPDARVAEAAWNALHALVGAPEGVTDWRAPEAAEPWKTHLLERFG